MIRLARMVVAMPGKAFELQAALKEVVAAVKEVSGVEVTIMASFGSQVGEFVSASNYESLADFEEKGAKIIGSAQYQAAIRKFEGLIVPGSARDHLMRTL